MLHNNKLTKVLDWRILGAIRKVTLFGNKELGDEVVQESYRNLRKVK